MYEEQPSFFARFSGFFLFLIALLVVGFLVFLTVRSAQENSGDGDLAATTSEESEVDEAPKSVGEQKAEEEAAEEETPAASDDQGVVATDDSDSGAATTADADDAQDEDDTDTANVASATDETSEAEETVAADQEDLPNTGPTETAAAITVTAVLVAAGISFRNEMKAREATSLSRSI